MAKREAVLKEREGLRTDRQKRCRTEKGTGIQGGTGKQYDKKRITLEVIKIKSSRVKKVCNRKKKEEEKRQQEAKELAAKQKLVEEKEKKVMAMAINKVNSQTRKRWTPKDVRK